ncbi:MAG: prepilin-type N-terminal cleavage/methylation domain-containing protein [Candidatus Schekmanbacteria bacterium]|nr:prepilin-type N-terminal cleavage/methylation domain-containing protein [Candidatus Schekmanbacteria bacterium]
MTGKPAKQAGFTLVELMITVTIIGLLAAVAYPHYRRYLTDSESYDAQAVIENLASAEKTERQLTGAFTLGTAPTDTDGDGWAEASDGNSCYIIGTTVVRLGDAPNFEFQITTLDAWANTFVITAQGKDGLVDSGDQLIFDYDATRNPREQWTANGSFSAP